MTIVNTLHYPVCLDHKSHSLLQSRKRGWINDTPSPTRKKPKVSMQPSLKRPLEQGDDRLDKRFKSADEPLSLNVPQMSLPIVPVSDPIVSMDAVPLNNSQGPHSTQPCIEWSRVSDGLESAHIHSVEMIPELMAYMKPPVYYTDTPCSSSSSHGMQLVLYHDAQQGRMTAMQETSSEESEDVDMYY